MTVLLSGSRSFPIDTVSLSIHNFLNFVRFYFKDVPHLVLVPPSVVLQHNQTEVEVNCSVWSSKRPASLQWIVVSIFNQQTNQNFTMTEVTEAVQINPCIAANVTQITKEDKNVAKLNLLLKVTDEPRCFEALQTGKLYLRGLCMASSDLGATSETFVLDIISNELEVSNLAFIILDLTVNLFNRVM